MELKQWVESRYRHPVVVVVASRTVETACRRNGMDFVNLLRPFSVCNTDLFARLTDRADATAVRNFGVRLTRPQCVREIDPSNVSGHLRELLRECSDIEMAFGEQLDRSVRCLLKSGGGGVLNSGRLSADSGTILLERSHSTWHRRVVQSYLNLVRCSHFDTTDHPVGFIYAASTSAPGGVEGVLREFRDLKTREDLGEIWRNMPCMEEETHNYFILVHDETEGPGEKEVQQMFQSVQSHFSHANSCLVRINSVSDPQAAKCIDPQLWIEANPPFMDVPSHTACRAATYSHQRLSGKREETEGVSPLKGTGGIAKGVVGISEVEDPTNFAHITTMFGRWPDGTPMVTGCYLSPDNVEGLRHAMHHYLSQCLFIYIERKLRALNTIVNERRTTTLGKMAAWFRNKSDSKSKQESWVSARNGVGAMYVAGSLEMQARRAADLSLTLSDYEAAGSFYRLCRAEALATVSSRPFNKPMIAAAQEGIGICHLLQGRLVPSSAALWKPGGTISKSSSGCKLETAMNDYEVCDMSDYMLRVALLLYEFCRTRTPPSVDRATAYLQYVQDRGAFIQNKLYSAIVGELLAANALLLNPPQPAGMKVCALIPNNFLARSHVRTYAKHCIVAGDAYLEDKLFQCALRCYLRALCVYNSIGRCGSWPRVCEHLFTSISRVYQELNNPVCSLAMASVTVGLGTPMFQEPDTALSALKVFLKKQQEVVAKHGLEVSPHMVVPCVVENTVTIVVDQYHCDETTTQLQWQLGNGVVETEWQNMEDKLRACYKGQMQGSSVGSRYSGQDFIKIKQLIKKDNNGNIIKALQRYVMNQEETLQVSVVLRNPIGVPLTVSNISVLFISKKDPTKLCRTADSRTVNLKALASDSVTIDFTPTDEGTYVIVGFSWEVLGVVGHYYFATESGSLTPNAGDGNKGEGSHPGVRDSMLFEYAMKNPMPDVESPANIEISVGPPQAWVTMYLQPDIPPMLRDGEYFYTSVVITNKSSYTSAHNITLQRSPQNAHILWFEKFGLDRNADAEATFNVAEILNPKESITIPLTVRPLHGHGNSPRCRNNVLFLLGYMTSPVSSPKQPEAGGTCSTSPTARATMPQIRLHRYLRLFAVNRALLLSSFAVEPVNLAAATSAFLLTVKSGVEETEPAVCVTRMMAVHRERWHVDAVHRDALLKGDTSVFTLPAGGSLCVPIAVSDRATFPVETAGAPVSKGGDNLFGGEGYAFTEEESVPLTFTVPSVSDRSAVELNIGKSVAKSEMNVYFMRTSFLGPGTVGVLNANDELLFYADKGPDGGKPKMEGVEVAELADGQPFTPICIAVAWTMGDSRQRSGQVFYFFDPVNFILNGASHDSNTDEQKQEKLCNSLVRNHCLHPRHAAVLYHVESPQSVESTAELPDTAIIPITVHCRSLASVALLVTVCAPHMLCDDSSQRNSPSPPSPALINFVGRTKSCFLLLPHQSHTIKFTACAFQPGVVQCNAFQVSAVALRLRLSPVSTSAWTSGMPLGAMIRSIRCSALSSHGSPRTVLVGGEQSNSGSNDTTQLPLPMMCDVQTSVFGKNTAAITRVVLNHCSQAAVEAAKAANIALSDALCEKRRKYEEEYKRFEVCRSSCRNVEAASAVYRPSVHMNDQR